MAEPAQIDIIADRRVVYEEAFTFFDLDLTGSTFKIQIRRVKDTTGTPLLSLTTPSGIALAYAGTDTVANHVTATRLSGTGTDSIYKMINPATGVVFAPSDSLTLSRIGVDLDVSTFPIPDEVGDDLACWYDILQIPAAGANKLLMRGSFTVRAGVTIP